MDFIQALQSKSAEERRQAAYALGRSREITAVPALVLALQDSYSGVQREAADALDKIGAAAVPMLIQVLKSNNDLARQYAAQALGQIRDGTAVPALILALQDSNSGVRRSAAYALGEIGDVSAVSALIHALQDSNEWVRVYAAEALGKLDVSAVPALIQALQSCGERVHQYVIQALGKMGGTTHLPLKVLAATHIPAAHRIAILNVMGQVHYQNRALFEYKMLPVERFCEQILQRSGVSEEVKMGAGEILAQKMLLRPGTRNSTAEPQELLRVASSDSDASAVPVEALRASEALPRAEV